MNYLVAIFGAVCAALVEYQFKTHEGWLAVWWFTIPGAIAVNWAVWWLVRADGLIAGFVCFSFATMLCRMVLTLTVGDPVAGKVWVAAGLIVLANIVKVVF